MVCSCCSFSVLSQQAVQPPSALLKFAEQWHKVHQSLAPVKPVSEMSSKPTSAEFQSDSSEPFAKDKPLVAGPAEPQSRSVKSASRVSVSSSESERITPQPRSSKQYSARIQHSNQSLAQQNNPEQIAASEQQLQRLERQNKRLQVQVQAANNAKSEKLALTIKQLNELQQLANSESMANRNLRRDKLALTERLELMTNKLAQVKRELAELTQQQQNYRSKDDKSNQSLNSLKQQKEEQIKQNQALLNKNRELIEQLNELKVIQEQAATQAKENFTLKATINQAKQQAEASTLALQRIQIENQQFKEKLAAKQKELEISTQFTKNGKSDLASQQKLSQALQQDNQQLTEKLKQITAQAKSLTEQLAQQQHSNSETSQLQANLNQVSIERDKLKQQLQDTTKQVQALEHQLTEQQTAAISLQQQLTRQLEDAEKANQQARQNIQKSTERVTELTQQLTEAKANKVVIDTAETDQSVSLKSDNAQQDYAVGHNFAQQLLNALSMNKLLGINSDSKALKAGMLDGLDGKSLLKAEQLAAAAHTAGERVVKARARILREQSKISTKAVTKFMRDPAAKQDDSGFFWRIVQPGKQSIPAGATLKVMINESLADGKEIENMEKTGMALQEKLDRFPVIFQKVLRHLKTEGSAVVLIPPSLAYGDDGLPPAIPPGATMQYEIKLLGIEKD